MIGAAAALESVLTCEAQEEVVVIVAGKVVVVEGAPQAFDADEAVALRGSPKTPPDITGQCDGDPFPRVGVVGRILVAVSTVQLVEAGTPLQVVVIDTAEQMIIAVLTMEKVMAPQPIGPVVSAAGVDPIDIAADAILVIEDFAGGVAVNEECHGGPSCWSETGVRASATAVRGAPQHEPACAIEFTQSLVALRPWVVQVRGDRDPGARGA